MSKVDYDSMTKAELKQYFLRHREDKFALQAYLDRVNQRPLKTIAEADDPDFEKKLEAAVLRQIGKVKIDTRDSQMNLPSE